MRLQPSIRCAVLLALSLLLCSAHALAAETLALGRPYTWSMEPNYGLCTDEADTTQLTDGAVGHDRDALWIQKTTVGWHNVGRALSDLDGEVAPDQWIVCEVSSFQLEDVVEFQPKIAVLLNLEPDHLDRHGSFEDYRRANNLGRGGGVTNGWTFWKSTADSQ